MLYQPENYDDCMKINCKKCIMSNPYNCIAFDLKKVVNKFDLTKGFELIEKREKELGLVN